MPAADSNHCMDATTLGTAIIRLQIASDGQWEQSLHLTQRADAVRKTRGWLAAQMQNLAIEAFIPVPHGLAFVGVRLNALPAHQQHDLALQLAAFFAEQEILTTYRFIEWVESLLARSLFKAPPAFLELGKVNAWRSFGSVVFWPDKAGRTPLDAFQAAMGANPRFCQPSDLPYAVEWGFDGLFPHWIGKPISAVQNGLHCIAPDAVHGALPSLNPPIN